MKEKGCGFASLTLNLKRRALYSEPQFKPRMFAPSLYIGSILENHEDRVSILPERIKLLGRTSVWGLGIRIGLRI